MTWLNLLAPVYLGWSLGANDASNVFGTAVASRMVRFWTAAVLASCFVLLGAVLEGEAGMRTVGALSSFDAESATLSSLAAAIAVTLLTFLRLPVSTSQAVVGAVIGVGIFKGGVDTSGLPKIISCWIGTPIGAFLIALLLYRLLTPLVNRLGNHIAIYDVVLRLALVVVGSYGAYALGANNVANVTGVFVGAGLLSPFAAAVLGGSAIALGIVTYSRRVMMTVGKGIVRLNAYGAFIVVLAQALTVHAYAMLGVPVSSSQAVVGAVLGVGVLKSIETVRFRAVLGIFSGWLATPALSISVAMALYVLTHLRFVG
jgi:PiT family inorganic phosphate transporter